MPDGAGSPLERARAAQALASDPRASAFVPASAGSGKTKLLVDRVLRLILSGVDPGRILCLTFTTAAAAEMDSRLRNRLAQWAIADDAQLRGWLAELGVSDRRMDDARRFFATVLDHPGGLRIQNFHSFCQSVLRRFPLEAAISPQFRLIEALDEAAHRTRARAHAVAHPDADLDLPSQHARSPDHLAAILRDFERHAPDDHASAHARLRAALGATHANEDAVIRDAVVWPEEGNLADIIRERTLPAIKSARARDATQVKLGWLSAGRAERVAAWSGWHRAFLTADHEPYSWTWLLGRAGEQPEIASAYAREAARVQAVRHARNAIRLADISAAMLRLASPARHAYAATKQATGGLDFDDLIRLSGELLHDPGAAWVLFKLDGGLDHLLLDEVQDTSPAQWQIAHALAGEFFTPGSARDGVRRTAFAVGDPKQSIFGFQGAEIAAFATNRDRWSASLRAIGDALSPAHLDVSFRSAPPILALVDAVFAAGTPWNEGVGNTRHHPVRAHAAGTITLWPPEPREPTPQRDGFAVAPPAEDAPAALARKIAAWVAERLDDGRHHTGRALHAGDVLILLRNRAPLMAPLVAALKHAGIPVAGADRFPLLTQISVRDILALCDVILLPEDDLALAQILRSPFCAVDEASLYDLAQPRAARAPLWQALRDRARERPEWAAALATIEYLRALADRLTPHALLSEALRLHGGRAKIFARLSAEAAEGIDELLTLALDYARAYPASLHGFAAWVRASGAEVKREAQAAGDVVRIMTIHGAKGLQAPVVILPDTMRVETVPKQPVVLVGGLPVWAVHKAFATPATDAALAAMRRAEAEETNRLLYVALTRAEDEMLVCGIPPKPRKTPPDDPESAKPEKPAKPNWHSAIAGALEMLGAEPFDTPDGHGLRLASPGAMSAPPSPQPPPPSEPLPTWAGSARDWTPSVPPAAPARPSPLAPSRPEGAAYGPLPPRASPLHDGPDRFARGTLIHALLQHLPQVPQADRPAAAARYAAHAASGQAGKDAADAVAETLAILDHPDLHGLFGPGSRAEVPVTGLVGGRVVGGVIDRLLVTPGRVLIADFKTNARPPADVAATPAAYMAQLAAYRALLRQIFPGRPVDCALIWTRTATVSVLPGPMLDAAAAAFA